MRLRYRESPPECERDQDERLDIHHRNELFALALQAAA
jgi:hypothetical protein